VLAQELAVVGLKQFRPGKTQKIKLKAKKKPTVRTALTVMAASHQLSTIGRCK
jgi:hypothetical protein